MQCVVREAFYVKRRRLNSSTVVSANERHVEATAYVAESKARMSALRNPYAIVR